nr:MAG TPA: hypothetical protein [Caudoviricetes sp.]
MKRGLSTPRMLKYLKEEWAIFLDDRGRKRYNEFCRKSSRQARLPPKKNCRIMSYENYQSD